MNLPSFVIIGAPRSGTTTLYHHLSRHPQVFMASEKEVHFFDRHYERGLDWYSGRFDGAAEGQVLGEATPRYLGDAEAMSRLATTIPNATLIAILREPQSAIRSHFHYLCARGVDSGTIESAVERELAGEPEAFPYIGIRRYGDHIDLIEHDLGLHVEVLWFDDLRSEPNQTLARACELIGVAPPSESEVVRPVNSADRFRSARIREWSKKAPRPIKRVIGKLNRSEAEYPPLPPATRELIIDELAASNARLAARTGRDLSSWSQ